MAANTIQEVIDQLEAIITSAKEQGDPAGYFAALYQKVTITVKEKIDEGYFDDNARMEKLDVVFANRYLNAHRYYLGQQGITQSWERAFELTGKRWPIVLQHLLMGMNAHINLDLGIAAAAISTPKNMASLKGDFNKINEVLSSLVAEVETDMKEIWPALAVILKLTNKVDDFLIDFSMERARDGAWKFAQTLAGKSPKELEGLIDERDQKIGRLSRIVSNPGPIIRLVFGLIRLTEKGDVRKRITFLEEHYPRVKNQL